ncbi:MAG: hypothetical protein LUG93_17515 [Lachnospiraceae bacterium]|nr:hypothetical protein [Lachnospiraceae bacterium]
MLKFYFYNSYQGSMTGFQITGPDEQNHCLRLCGEGEIDERIYKSFTTGGIKAILMRDGRGKNTFLVRNMKVKPVESGQLWYLNFSVTAELPEDEAALAAIVREHSLHCDAFVERLLACFRQDKMGEPSYQADLEALYAYVAALPATGSELPSDHRIVKKFNQMLQGLDQISRSPDIYFLATEAGEEYFQKMHPEFKGCVPLYSFDLKDYVKLLHFKEEYFSEPETKKASEEDLNNGNSKKQRAGKVDASDRDGFYPIVFLTIVLVVILICLLVRFIKRQ